MKYESNDVCDYAESFREIILEKLQVATGVSADADMFQRSKLEITRHVMDQLAFTFRSFVWAEPPKRIEVRYPSTWWDAFKERWFPQWALEAYPPDYERKVMEAQHFYPSLPQTSPDYASRLRLLVRDSERFCG